MTAATGAWAQTSDKETPLTLQATADGKITIDNPKVGMKYKVGDGEKQTVTSTDDVDINVTADQTVQFFGNGTSITAYGVEQGGDTKFDSNVKCYIYGNIMSLVNEDGFAGATELTADYAFYSLFFNFRNLSNHPSRKLVLPATTLTKRCYSDMFMSCTGLTTAPALPATKLAERCYSDMFGYCTGLTTAPALPATELATKCYYTMFQNCTSLTTAPLLPAPTLAEGCYSNMFNGCTNLNAVNCLATNISAEGATTNWLKGVAATGTLTIAKWMEDKWTANSVDGIPSGWTTDVYGYKVKLADRTADAGNWTATVGTKVKSVTATTDPEPGSLATPLTIEAITPGTIVVNIADEYGYPVRLETGMKYSVNGGDKETIKTTTEITVAKDDKVQFYGNGKETQVYGGEAVVSIQGSGDGFQTKVYGNIMSLLDETGFATKTELPNDRYVFYELFRGNATLIDASELLLPAATLAIGCYQQMFDNCTSLTKAPKLPATTLADVCYYGMFVNCTSLTNAYVKAAYTEGNGECSYMFYDCTADGAVLHTTPGSKESWEAKMGSGKDWPTWSVDDDWED